MGQLEMARAYFSFAKNVLLWNFNLKPRTIHEDATVMNYIYTMECDKNIRIQPRRIRE